MSQDLSDEAIKNAYSSTVQPDVVLLKITANNLPEPIYACDQPGGFWSRGVFYKFGAFTVSFGGASMDEPSKSARLEIENLDGSLTLAARTVKFRPQLLVEIVRLDEPDVVEQRLVGVKMDDVEVDDQRLIFTLSPRDFKREPAVAARYIMSRTPGLF